MTRANAALIATILGGCVLFVAAVLTNLAVLVTIGAILAGGGALLGIGATWLNDLLKEETNEH